METQEFMGRGQLVPRLIAQVGSKNFAMTLLKQRGDMDADGNLTAAGQERNSMTAEERALDRDNDGRPRTYNPLTNSTKLL
tara:strand:- start:1905 stop:2147 length:243 start_codon:yes stop_codon:yes gene_type:complete